MCLGDRSTCPLCGRILRRLTPERASHSLSKYTRRRFIGNYCYSHTTRGITVIITVKVTAHFHLRKRYGPLEPLMPTVPVPTSPETQPKANGVVWSVCGRDSGARPVIRAQAPHLCSVTTPKSSLQLRFEHGNQERRSGDTSRR